MATMYPMTQLMLDVLATVLPCLHPVDFMHTIEASKYLYKKYQSKIQEKRKESLVRFTTCNEVKDLDYNCTCRGTKLPNRKIEGKLEILTESHYSIYNYVNGVPSERRLVHSYLRYEPGYVFEKDKKLLRDNLADEFRKWKDIDVSKMKLEAQSEHWFCKHKQVFY